MNHACLRSRSSERPTTSGGEVMLLFGRNTRKIVGRIIGDDKTMSVLRCVAYNVYIFEMLIVSSENVGERRRIFLWLPRLARQLYVVFEKNIAT
ncbi:hypothetical protein Trydic_g16080 [Trypoxylus dichotomus]